MHGLIFETSVWLLAESTRLLPSGFYGPAVPKHWPSTGPAKSLWHHHHWKTNCGSRINSELLPISYLISKVLVSFQSFFWSGMARKRLKSEGLMFVTANQKIHKTGLNYLPSFPRTFKHLSWVHRGYSYPSKQKKHVFWVELPINSVNFDPRQCFLAQGGH